MSTRTLVIGLGVLLVLSSLFADAIGLGREVGFGWKQWAGLVVGIALVIGGVVWSRLSR